MNFESYQTEHLRLAALQALQQAAGYEMNEAMLRLALDAVGKAVSHDKLRTELGWLTEQGLVTQRTNGTLVIAAITPRGEDAALGRARVTGVARPRPGGGA